MTEWLMNVPVLSTLHIRQSTYDYLNGPTDHGYCVADYGEGMFIYVPEHIEGRAEPSDLRALFAWARRYKYEWVRLDSVGVDRDDLPTYPESWS